MENIKFSIFDLFAYTIPGCVALLAGAIYFNSNISQLSDLGAIFQNAGIGTGLLTIVVAYIIGFAIDTPGSWVYYKIGCRIWGAPYDPRSRKLSNSTERALVRHFSPENFSYIQLWKVVKTMSHNLSFASILLGITSTVKAFQVQPQYQLEWFSIAIISFIGSVIFLNRSNLFDKWHYRDLTETVNALRLEQRAFKEVEGTSNGQENSNKILEDLLIKRK